MDPERSKIELIATRMSGAIHKGDLGTIIAEEVLKYSVFELQVIGGRLNLEIERLQNHTGIRSGVISETRYLGLIMCSYPVQKWCIQETCRSNTGP